MPRKPPAPVPAATSSEVVGDIHRLIREARAGLAATVNSALTLLYWRIGYRIYTEVLQGSRAGYGKQLVADFRWYGRTPPDTVMRSRGSQQ